MNVFEKVARRITRLSWNHTVHHIIIEAMKRNIINSHQGHAILGAWNAECFPENGHASFLKAVEHTLAPDGAGVCRVINHVYVDGVCAECGASEIRPAGKA